MLKNESKKEHSEGRQEVGITFSKEHEQKQLGNSLVCD